MFIYPNALLNTAKRHFLLMFNTLKGGNQTQHHKSWVSFCTLPLINKRVPIFFAFIHPPHVGSGMGPINRSDEFRTEKDLS